MTDDEYLKSIREDLEESVDFFSSQDKFIREKVVVYDFLTNLSIEYEEDELLRGGDPPDVVFRDAQLEVKEIMGKGRKRHAEFKLVSRSFDFLLEREANTSILRPSISL